jgi:hypothetical protein
LCGLSPCGAGALARDRRMERKRSQVFNQPTGEAVAEKLYRSAERAMPLQAFAGEGARAIPYPENDVPHPHDFDAFGLVKTKPCCISVSW